MKKNIYKEIAKQYGISKSEVKRDIQAAIDEAYKSPNLCAQSVFYKGDKPTPEELVAHIARKVQSTDDSEK